MPRAIFARHSRMIRRRIPASLVPALEGEAEEDLGKIFGEELPSGLVVPAEPANS